MPDQRAPKELLRRRRAAEKVQRAIIDDELASLDRLDGAMLSPAAMERLQELLGGVRHRPTDRSSWRRHVDGALEVAVRESASATVVRVPEGTLTLRQLEVVLSRHGTDDER